MESLLGSNVIIRTVTLHFTGKVVEENDKWICLTDAAWIADTGRWSTAIATGALSEVEPYPDGMVVRIAVGAMVEIAPWTADLPRTVK